MPISHRCALPMLLSLGCGASPHASSEAPAIDRSRSEAVATRETPPPSRGEPVESETAIDTSAPDPASGPDPRIHYVDSFAGEAFVLVGTAPSFPRRGARVLREPDDDGSLTLCLLYTSRCV